MITRRILTSCPFSAGGCLAAVVLAAVLDSPPWDEMDAMLYWTASGAD